MDVKAVFESDGQMKRIETIFSITDRKLGIRDILTCPFFPVPKVAIAKFEKRLKRLIGSFGRRSRM